MTQFTNSNIQALLTNNKLIAAYPFLHGPIVVKCANEIIDAIQKKDFNLVQQLRDIQKEYSKAWSEGMYVNNDESIKTQLFRKFLYQLGLDIEGDLSSISLSYQEMKSLIDELDAVVTVNDYTVFKIISHLHDPQIFSYQLSK